MNRQFSPYSSLISHNNPKLFQHWIELSQSALNHNAAQFKQWLGAKTNIAAVIKSNAYGHGLLEMAHLYQECPDIAALCVINVTEGIFLRQNGIKKPIFVIGYLDAPYEHIINHNLQVSIFDLITAERLNFIGEKYRTPINVHIKFDTGMNRLGVKADELITFIKQVENLAWIKIVGIFTHLAQSYHAKRTIAQEFLFAQALSLPYAKHISNSHGFMTIQYTYDFARIGIGLYGYLQRQTDEQQKLLRPVLSLKTKILQIKTIQAGEFVGYDGLFQAPSDMTIAILAIGYYEGLDARLSNKGYVLINGFHAPIIGRICMNLTIVDISSIHNCTIGQTVTVLGQEKHCTISAYDWSALTGASVYNHLTKLGHLVPKIIVS